MYLKFYKTFHFRNVISYNRRLLVDKEYWIIHCWIVWLFLLFLSLVTWTKGSIKFFIAPLHESSLVLKEVSICIFESYCTIWFQEWRCCGFETTYVCTIMQYFISYQRTQLIALFYPSTVLILAISVWPTLDREKQHDTEVSF